MMCSPNHNTLKIVWHHFLRHDLVSRYVSKSEFQEIIYKLHINTIVTSNSPVRGENEKKEVLLNGTNQVIFVTQTTVLIYGPGTVYLRRTTETSSSEASPGICQRCKCNF
jgi:hypothetical protein